MFSLRPALEPQRRPEPGQAPPVYAYDPSVVYRDQPSFVNDLRRMGGREARNLTFGAAFGAASGFYLARLLIGLLKFALVLGVIAVLIALARGGGASSSRATGDSDSAPAEQAPPRPLHATARPVRYAAYTNERFGFQMQYPHSFQLRPAPENGDGQAFASPDGTMMISASGGNTPGTLEEEMAQAQAAAPGTVVDKKVWDNGFVLAWDNPQKGIAGLTAQYVGSASRNMLVMAYARNRADMYRPVAEKVWASFRPGDVNSAW